MGAQLLVEIIVKRRVAEAIRSLIRYGSASMCTFVAQTPLEKSPVEILIVVCTRGMMSSCNKPYDENSYLRHLKPSHMRHEIHQKNAGGLWLHIMHGTFAELAHSSGNVA